MSQRNFNGTTFALGNATQGKITSMQINQGCAKIDVYEPGDVVRLFELGVPTASVSIGLRCGNAAAPTLGATGASTITLGSGNTLSIPGANWQCQGVNRSGREDGPWEGTAEYNPCPS